MSNAEQELERMARELDNLDKEQRKVWVVFECVAFVGDVIYNVMSTKEGAEELASKLREEEKEEHISYIVAEYDVHD